MSEPTAFVTSVRARLVVPLVAAHVAGATRLAADFVDRDAAMWFGQYYVLVAVIAWIGWSGRWRGVSWLGIAHTMFLVGFLGFGVWTAIAYTTGQFLEWTDGRFDPGGVTMVDGVEVEREGRAPPIMESGIAKVGVGLAHGLITSLVSGIWGTIWATALIWLPDRIRGGRPTPGRAPTP